MNGNSQKNGFIIFDYRGQTDFKYAGIDIAANVLRIGKRTATGRVDTAVVSAKLNGSNFAPTLAVNGATAVLTVGRATLHTRGKPYRLISLAAWHATGLGESSPSSHPSVLVLQY